MSRFTKLLVFIFKTWLGRITLAVGLVVLGVIGFKLFETAKIFDYIYGAGLFILVATALVLFGFAIIGMFKDIFGKK